MTVRPSTQIGAPGPRPLGAPQNGAATPAGTTPMTLGTLREVRNELASLGELMERMSREMNGLRRAVEAVASREPRLAEPEPRAEKAAKKAARREAEDRAAREAELTARVETLEKRLRKLKRRVDWLG